MSGALEAACGAESAEVFAVSGQHAGSARGAPAERGDGLRGSRRKGGLRGRPSLKPRIDIDADIEEANRLADLFKRMTHASKAAAKNALKSKQRLMRKANKLSPEDLLRLAVLKRCGFGDPGEEADGGDGLDPGSSAGACLGGGQSKGSVSTRLHDMVASTPGASEPLKGLDHPISVNPFLSLEPTCVGAVRFLSGRARDVACPSLKRLPASCSNPSSKRPAVGSDGADSLAAEPTVPCTDGKISDGCTEPEEEVK
jgi:hypothetical protein